jgi:hypothetical protein
MSDRRGSGAPLPFLPAFYLPLDLGVLRYAALGAAGVRDARAHEVVSEAVILAKLRRTAADHGMNIQLTRGNDSDPLAVAWKTGVLIFCLERTPRFACPGSPASRRQLLARAAEFVSEWRAETEPALPRLMDAAGDLAAFRQPGFPARMGTRVAPTMTALLAEFASEIAAGLERRADLRCLIELADQASKESLDRWVRDALAGKAVLGAYPPLEEDPRFDAAAKGVDAHALAAWVSQELSGFNEAEAEADVRIEVGNFQRLCGRLALRGPADETAPGPLAAEDSAYRPASELRTNSPPAMSHKRLMTALARNPWIRRDKPSKQRLRIHAGDWSRFVAMLNAAGFDALDVNAETEEGFLADVRRRQAEIRQRKAGK